MCGVPIGILCLETYYGKVPGHIRNASTFSFPVSFKVVKGATPSRLVNQADRQLLEPFIHAARELQQDGVLAITGSCGFMALFQKEIADSVEIPVFISSLIQVPMVYRMLRRHQKVGILTANKSTLGEAHLEAVGARNIPVCVAGMEDKKEFSEVILRGLRNELDVDRLRDEVLETVDSFAKKHPEMGALVIECTDLPPFAHLIQKRMNIPVFDLVTLTNMVYEALVRTEFRGIMPPRISRAMA